MTAPEPHVNLDDRESLIRWLVWADPNGCHTDADCTLEGLPVHTLETALICYRDISDVWQEFDEGAPTILALLDAQSEVSQ